MKYVLLGALITLLGMSCADIIYKRFFRDKTETVSISRGLMDSVIAGIDVVNKNDSLQHKASIMIYEIGYDQGIAYQKLRQQSKHKGVWKKDSVEMQKIIDKFYYPK